MSRFSKQMPKTNKCSKYILMFIVLFFRTNDSPLCRHAQVVFNKALFIHH